VLINKALIYFISNLVAKSKHMKVFIKFEFNTVCNKILEEKLAEIQIKHRVLGFGEVEFLEKVSKEQMNHFQKSLQTYGIDIVENQKTILIQKIKDTIVDLVFNEDLNINVKSSVYLAEKLGMSYGYLSNLFSEVTYTSIENFFILQKIEYAKQLIVNNELSLTEIAFKLSYSSVAHLSSQFKKTTGITPSAFQRIIKKRREIASDNLI
jgi:AraC-like DNA-binding protein